MEKEKQKKKIMSKKKKEIKNDSMKKHNGIIGLWKFLFCIMIILHHGKDFNYENSRRLFVGGNIAVEFFFIVSGFLMAKSALNKKDFDKDNLGKETFNFILKKIKSFLPYTITAGIILLIINNIFESISIRNNILSMLDIFLIEMTGIKIRILNGPLWYISSMLICMAILYPLIRKYKYNYIYIFLPLSVLLIMGYSNHLFNNLKGIHEWVGFTYRGNLRAFADLSIGIFIYAIYENLKNIEFTFIGKLVLTIIEIIGFIFPFIIGNFVKNPSQFDIIVIILLSISILIAFSEKTLEYNIMNNKIIKYLEKLSISMYIFHYPIGKTMLYTKYFKKFTYIQNLFFFIIFTFFVSVILTYIINILKKNDFYSYKLKRIIINKKSA